MIAQTVFEIKIALGKRLDTQQAKRHLYFCMLIELVWIRHVIVVLWKTN